MSIEKDSLLVSYSSLSAKLKKPKSSTLANSFGIKETDCK